MSLSLLLVCEVVTLEAERSSGYDDVYKALSTVPATQYVLNKC